MDGDGHGKYLTKVGPNLYRSTSGMYYLLVKRGSKQFRRSLRTTDKAIAKRRLRDFQDNAAKLAGSSDFKTLTFQELATRWLASRQGELKPNSFNRRKSALKGLSPFFNTHLVRTIGQREIEHWKKDRGNNLSARSWNIEIETLKQIFGYAKNELRVLIDNPSDTLKRRKEKKGHLEIPSKEQFRSLLKELQSGHRSTGEAANFIEFLAYSGCRQQEAASVLWNDVNFELNSLLITGGIAGTKNHESRTLPLFPPLRRLLETMNTARAEDPRLFQIRDARLQIQRACERIGLPRYGHHTMRHFFCSNAIEAGCDFKVIAGWLGHKDGGVLVARTYGHLRNEHSEAMAKRITFDASETCILPEA